MHTSMANLASSSRVELPISDDGALERVSAVYNCFSGTCWME